ncbi:MAG: hypothetical protein H6806_11375 [Planctomycetes bacterium]|nr:hypothetical protein [Planctomycetota bacterium]MCB9825550.1 hypothetical protein [Planctomycetota bacterium]MCB9830344.1 hypothetical protein [Planctomycetota bacterium]MCB9900644.1 hypothetical protein [Planctomycetota bacterium]
MPFKPLPARRLLVHGCWLLALAATACRGLPPGVPHPEHLPLGPAAWRAEGERLPARAAPDPLLAGWTRVDDLHYVAPEDADAYAQGLVRVGADLVPRAQPLPTETPVEGGHVLRTDHVLLRTNVSYELALDVAREAELHVQRVFEAWGEALDIRFPADAVVVLLMATREEFAMHLAHRVAEPVGWGAFYDATTGIVNVCAEPAPRGALPWTADLRHEMTHQLLDLSRPPRRRGQAFGAPWFWLWEGIAVHAEQLGDTGPRPTNVARYGRFRRRLYMGQWAPLRDLVAREARDFEGRHYDQTASWMSVLLTADDPARTARVLQAVRDLLAGRSPGTVEAVVGRSLEAEEAAWLETWRSRFGRRRPR